MPDLRVAALVVLLAGLAGHAAISSRRHVDRRTGATPWIAPIPIAVLLAFGTIPAPEAAIDGSDCPSPLSPPAVWRALEAALVLPVVAIVARALRSSPAELALRRPTAPIAWVAILGGLLVGAGSVALGPPLAAPFFGPIALPGASEPAAILPAALFALANGAMEEIVYRGALVAWLTRLVGTARAVGVAALLFGFQHATGTEFTGSALPVVAALAGGGVVASLIVMRTRSLAIPLALHAGFDVGLYYYWACRF